MRAAPLPHCTVTCVVAVVSLPHVLGVLAVKPAERLWALVAAWMKTSFKLIAEMVALRGLHNLISPVQIFGRP